MKKERDFKGIWIPKEIWLSKDLTLQEKVFLVEIDSLDNESGCFAGNEYFAEFFKISKTRASIVINNLVRKNYISSTIIYREGSKEILKRVLKVCYRPYPINVIDPIEEKLKDNNTVNNTTNNTINKSILPEEFLTVSEKLKEKLLEFVEYRKRIKKAIKTEVILKTLITGIGKEYINEEHLMQCIDKTMNSEWVGVKGEYVKYKLIESKPTKPITIEEVDYEHIASECR